MAMTSPPTSRPSSRQSSGRSPSRPITPEVIAMRRSVHELRSELHRVQRRLPTETVDKELPENLRVATSKEAAAALYKVWETRINDEGHDATATVGGIDELLPDRTLDDAFAPDVKVHDDLKVAIHAYLPTEATLKASVLDSLVYLENRKAREKARIKMDLKAQKKDDQLRERLGRTSPTSPPRTRKTLGHASNAPEWNSSPAASPPRGRPIAIDELPEAPSVARMRSRELGESPTRTRSPTRNSLRPRVGSKSPKRRGQKKPKIKQHERLPREYAKAHVDMIGSPPISESPTQEQTQQSFINAGIDALLSPNRSLSVGPNLGDTPLSPIREGSHAGSPPAGNTTGQKPTGTGGHVISPTDKTALSTVFKGVMAAVHLAEGLEVPTAEDVKLRGLALPGRAKFNPNNSIRKKGKGKKGLDDDGFGPHHGVTGMTDQDNDDAMAKYMKEMLEEQAGLRKRLGTSMAAPRSSADVWEKAEMRRQRFLQQEEMKRYQYGPRDRAKSPGMLNPRQIKSLAPKPPTPDRRNRTPPASATGPNSRLGGRRGGRGSPSRLGSTRAERARSRREAGGVLNIVKSQVRAIASGRPLQSVELSKVMPMEGTSPPVSPPQLGAKHRLGDVHARGQLETKDGRDTSDSSSGAGGTAMISSKLEPLAGSSSEGGGLGGGARVETDGDPSRLGRPVSVGASSIAPVDLKRSVHEGPRPEFTSPNAKSPLPGIRRTLPNERTSAARTSAKTVSGSSGSSGGPSPNRKTLTPGGPGSGGKGNRGSGDTSGSARGRPTSTGSDDAKKEGAKGSSQNFESKMKQWNRFPNGRWQGMVISNLPFGNGVFEYKSGAVYSGGMREGKRWGLGKMTFPDGMTVNCQWNNDNCHGEVTVVFADKSKFKKQYVDNLIESSHVYADGRKYTGWWSGPFMHGKGVMDYPNGDRFEGLFQHSMREGQGRLVMPGGSWFQGLFVDDKPYGEGRAQYMLKNGHLYIGPTLKAVPHGHGTLALDEGQAFEVEWENGEAKIEGRLFPGSGVLYTGGMCVSFDRMQAFCHGRGILTFTDGFELEIDFEYGHGSGKRVFANDEGEYEGQMYESEMCGRGTLTWDGGTYAGDFREDTFNGEGTLRDTSEDVSYIGSFKDGVFEGTGHLEKKDLSYKGTFHKGEYHGSGCLSVHGGDSMDERGPWTYTGEMLMGKMHGDGEVIYENGFSYKGSFVDGLMDGSGLLKEPGAPDYDGEFEEGTRHGEAKISYKDGSYFEGTNINGVFHGEGSWTDARAGTKYIGEFYEGKRHGKGRLEWMSGSVHEGAFVNDEPHGEGVRTYGNGGVLHSVWVNGQVCGYGKMNYSNGDVYEGEFWNGLRQGDGTMDFKDGSTFVGRWENDLFANGVLDLVNGGRYEGPFQDGKRSGTGKWEHDGDTYEGAFVNDKFEGKGVRVYSGGRRYAGSFVNGLYHGEGILTDGNDEDVYEGFYKNGLRHGDGRVYRKGSTDSKVGRWEDDVFVSGKTIETLVRPNKKREVFKGRIENGVRHGMGTCIYEDGSVFDGTFENGQRKQGTFSAASGRPIDVFMGEFQDDRPHKGRGVRQVLIGRKGLYVGEFFQGQRSGRGWMRYDAKATDAFVVNFLGTWSGDERRGLGNEWEGQHKVELLDDAGPGVLRALYQCDEQIAGSGIPSASVPKTLREELKEIDSLYKIAVAAVPEPVVATGSSAQAITTVDDFWSHQES